MDKNQFLNRRCFVPNKMPCKDCKDRYVGCHDHCEKYLKAKRELDELRVQLRKEHNEEWKETCEEFALYGGRRKK